MLKFEIYGSSHDYVLENARFEYNDAVNSVAERMEMAIQEADVLLEAILGIDFVTEADNPSNNTSKSSNVTKVATAPVRAAKSTVNGIKTVSNKAGDIVKKVIAFIKNLFNRLVDTLQTWFQNSGKWLEARKDAFDKFKYDNLEIEMVPYWEGVKSNSIQKTSRSILQYMGDALRIKVVNSEELEYDGFVNRRLKDYVGEDGDLADGMKNLYRTGSPKGKDRTRLRGNVLKAMVTGEMIPSILQYDKYIKEAENIQRTLDARALAVSRDLDRRKGTEATTESALFGISFEHTEFANYEEFDYLMENKKPEEKGRTQVTLNQDKRTDDQRKSDKEASDFEEGVQTKDTGEVKILSNSLKAERIMMSCYLTVMQERYTAYMNALKAIWSASNNEGGRNKDANGEGVVAGKTKKEKDE